MRGATSVSEVALDYLPMDVADLDWVTQTEQASTAHPWTRQHFADSLSAGYSAWVMRADAQAIGYGVMLLQGDEAHLLTITLKPNCQGRGFGALLLSQLGIVAQRFGAVNMFLEVRPSNAPALALYQRFGFELVGRRKAYYPAAQGREDALVMRWSMT